MHADRFLTASLRESPWGAAISRVLAAAVAAVDPATAVRKYLEVRGDQLLIGAHTYDLRDYDRIVMVGAGKAGVPMAQAAAAVLGERLSGGVVIVKEGYGAPVDAAPGGMLLLEAGHPVPDQRGVAGAQQIAALLGPLTRRDLALALISGGGSALVTLPVPGVSLADLQSLTATLLACGATINEINALRKHLDQLKGGGLARLAFPASLVALILSDVVGNPLDVIASGPTVADPASFADAWAVLERYHVSDRAPASIVSYLQRGLAHLVPETVKPGDASLAHVTNVLIGSNRQAAEAAMAQARTEGFSSLLLTTHLQGEAREAGRFLGAIGRSLALDGDPLPRPACLVIGGETTVTVRGTGRGGRNQELALAAVHDLADLEELILVTLATDGGDGPTDAAGAVVTGRTLARARMRGIDPSDALARNDAYPFFATLDDLLRPGPTRTNVNDLALLFAPPI